MTDRALVLGGGGLVGGAWAIGMLAGLADAGVDLTAADLVIGTSAGSLIGAQLASGRSVEELYEEQLGGPDGGVTVRVTLGQTARFLWAALGSRNPEIAVRRLGRAALGARTVPESDVHEAIGTLLPVRDWPGRPLKVAAVDARTGELTVFDSGSGVSLPLAVAASCAVPLVWPPITLGQRRLVDGGIRSTANADLASGHRRVAIIAPIPKGPGPMPSTARQAAELTRDGAEVALAVPGDAARRAMGRNLLDPARRAAAARAGRAEADAYAATMAAVWND
ncbi:patatin-like phospholipase family protein [Kitasatospora atroaurantiaca]|uniref:NTE family protein n=1 Tax=Kitasatospora atroaurantiaca TaxID=285545 RepID=A0A561ELI7_9ACTN|nr:patatin-like phospholipase family protein [Kitasatospora atroaurantiaca]TWE16432.1 NTE family protein [Kitasatospora atroaurantiaca]